MAPRPIFLSHPSSLDHDTGGHPENIARIVGLLAALEREDYLGWEQIRSPPAGRDTLLRVHPGPYVDAVARVAERGGGELDQDTVMSSGSFRAALHSAGGAVDMTTRLIESGAGAAGFSAHRPPGHHAIPARAMGFCLFNNIAIAAKHALAAHGLHRVMILDWDVHHGNGTQDIFYESDSVLFCSIHQWPLYPGSGRTAELGSGAGEGYTINLPVPPGSGDAEFVSLVRDVAAPLARSYRPQLLLVSAGYDAHRDDPLADCNVTDEGFATLATIWRELAVELGVPVGFVLEGGYDVAALSRSVVATMRALGGDAGAGGQLATGPAVGLATDALARLAPLWPDLAQLDR